MDENQREIYRIREESQAKLIYTILTVTIACIGFAITQTKTLKLEITQIPVGLSILFWAFSIYFGFRNRDYHLSFLTSNFDLLKAEKGKHFDTRKDHSYTLAYYIALRETTFSIGDKARKSYLSQIISFGLGSISYIFWHISKMSLR